VRILYARETMRPALSHTHSASSTNKAAHAAFVPIGMVTVLLGPLLPMLSARWSLNYAQAGTLFTAQFLGATIGTGLSGPIVSRWGYRFAILTGLFAMAVGVGSLPFSSRFPGLICIFSYGIGLGLSIPAANLLVAAMNADRRSAALSLLNFSWSVGAVACPFIVAVAAKVDQIRLFLVALAGFLLLVLLAIASLRSFVEPAVEPLLERKNEHPNAWLAHGSWRSLFILAALFFLYVGAENAFGGWIASYAQGLGSSSPTLSVMTPSFFYAALMVGRWSTPLVLKKTSEITAARAGLLLASMGMAGLIFSRALPSVLSSVSVAGLGLAAVYPITISRLAYEFGPAASRLGSVMFTLANLGGSFLPWAVGFSSHEFNNLGVGLAIPLAASALMLLLFHLYARNLGPAPA
jgi:FHS family glucose/mannose:H+ symporter-like MFS transporter